jgi:hypothetical protein
MKREPPTAQDRGIRKNPFDVFCSHERDPPRHRAVASKFSFHTLSTRGGTDHLLIQEKLC